MNAPVTPAPFDTLAFRKCLSQFPTGVCIVTAASANGPIGMTISSFNSLSLDPPLVLFSIDRRAQSLPAWEASKHCAIHILAQEQRDLSNRFARPDINKWEGLNFRTGENGTPILSAAAAVIECQRHAVHDGGDHLLFIEQVTRFRTYSDRKPLMFCQGSYHALGVEGHQADLWPLDIHY
jgi:flavin reductase (DIM6/NTAB) family NADH-FMN oxidoreductase RutF